MSQKRSHAPLGSGALGKDTMEKTAANGGHGGVTLRAILIAFFLLVLISPAGFYGELVYGASYMFAAGVPSMACIFLLFVLTGLNPVFPKFGWRSLSRKELLAIYGITLVGGPLMTHGILAWMIGHQIAPRYVAHAIPEWQNAFMEYFPAWFSPTDPAAAEYYFEGQSAVPWAHWRVPLLAWTSFMFAFFGCTLSAVILFRQLWITHERLSFPLAQVPLEMIKEDKASGRGGRLPVASLFWMGFIVICGLNIFNSLSLLWPAIPGIPLTGKTLMQWHNIGPLAGLGQIDLWLDPTMIAIAFLIPKELSFSCWFFWLLRVLMTVGAIAAGATPQTPDGWYSSGFPAPYYQGGGAVIALGLWALWTGRRYVAGSLRIAFGRSQGAGDSKEPMAYRWALLGFILCFIYMVYFCWVAGTRPLVGFIIIGLLVSYYVMWARLRADTGLGFLPFPLGIEELMLVPLGSKIFRPKEIINLIGLRWAYFPGFGESFEVVTGNALEAFKIADSARISSRRLLIAMVAGFVLSLGLGLYILLTGMYHYGFNYISTASHGWLKNQMWIVGGRIYEMLENPAAFDLNGTIALGAGAITAIGLGVLRLRFWWWPFHPFGYLAANCWGMHWYWMPLFVGWLWKSLTIRYGGLQLYRRLMPVAIGMIVGDMVGQGIRVALTLMVRKAV